MELINKFASCAGFFGLGIANSKVDNIDNLIEVLSNHNVTAIAHLGKFSVDELNRGVKKAKGEVSLPIFASLSSDEKSFDRMVEMGVNVHTINGEGDNLFMYAVKHGIYKSLDKIKNLGVDINKPSNDGEYPVHAATRRMFDRRFVSKLIELGADFSVKNSQGKTARDLLVEDLRSLDTRLTKRDLRDAYPYLSGSELNKNIAEETREIIMAVKQAERKSLVNKKGFKAKLASLF